MLLRSDNILYLYRKQLVGGGRSWREGCERQLDREEEEIGER